MMTLDAQVKRAKGLMLNGRYAWQVSKSDLSFEKMEELTPETVEGIVVFPYFDAASKKLIYGTFMNRERVTRFHYIKFLNADYFYDEKSAFTWVDNDRCDF